MFRKHFLSTITVLLSLCLTCSATRALAQVEYKPVGVISIAGYDQLLSVTDMVGQISGKPELKPMASQLINAMTGGLGPVGLDPKRPIGIVVAGPAKSNTGSKPGVYALIPTTDYKSLLRLAGNYIPINKSPNGMMTTNVAGMTIYIKQWKDWAIISNDAAMLDTPTESAATTIQSMARRYDVSLQLMISSIPQEVKMGVLMGYAAAIKQTQINPKFEAWSEKEKLSYIKTTDSIGYLIEGLLTGIDRIALGIRIDRETKNLFIDELTFSVPETKLAHSFSGLQRTTTRFAGFYNPEAVFSARASIPLPQAATDLLRYWIVSKEQSIHDKIDADFGGANSGASRQVKAWLASLLKVVDDTIESGDLDAAFSITYDDAPTVLAAMQITDGMALNKVLHEVVAQSVASGNVNEQFTPKLNIAKLGDIAIHTVTTDDDSMFKTLYVGVGPNAVYLALGENPGLALKRAIENSNEATNQTALPLESSIDGMKMIEFAAAMDDSGDTAELRKIGTLLNGKEEDHITLKIKTIQGRTAIRLAVENDLLGAMLRMIADSATEASSQASPSEQQNSSQDPFGSPIEF